MLRILLMIGFLVGPMALSAKQTTKDLSSSNLYTVESGDSLYTIAKKFKTSIEALKKANNLKEGGLLHPGQKLKLPDGTSVSPSQRRAKAKSTPGKTSTKSKPKTKPKKGDLQLYKVQAGDTLSTIARDHGVSVKEILKTNQMKSDTLIKVGQTLVIPRAAKGTAAAAQAKTQKPQKKTAQKTPQKKSAANKRVHTVQYGDTLFSIARKYKTPLKDLMSLNQISPTDVIHPGQELKIPGSSYRAKVAAAKKPAQKPQKGKTQKAKASQAVVYTVKHGDTLWEIAHRHRVSIQQIRRLNKLKRRQMLHSGMKLLIKEGTPVAKLAQKSKKAPVKKIAKSYTVKKGDTLWEIAKRHKVSVAELRKLNKMKRGDIIHTGMKLTVGYEKVPPTRLAKKSKKKKPTQQRVAKKTQKKSKTKKKTTRVASKSKKRKPSKKKSADRRINSALAALNSKGSGSRRSRGGDYNVIRTAKKYLGRRYVWGAEGPSSFDCSGFTQYVMRKSKGVKLPRVSRKQAYYGKYVTRSQLKPGDLIFFDTSRRRRGYVNHVGIYIGNGKFIHASSARHRVVITSLNSPFYRARFKWGRRVN